MGFELDILWLHWSAVLTLRSARRSYSWWTVCSLGPIAFTVWIPQV